ncbi:hypothetical protein M1N93_01940 [Dehalococcoidia bacterium]|nr:hypothetical protein [Dehalococcoidia bacterium]
MRRFMVIVYKEGGDEIHPMKDWLRHNLDYIPPGMHPSKSTSHQLCNGLKKLGWMVQETDTEVRLTMPSHADTDSPQVVRKQRGKASSAKLETRIVGNMGLYYVCYQLSRFGWNVMPTARNARGVDIIAYNRDCSRFVGVQVKALSKRDPVPLGKTLDNIMGDFWIIVNNLASTPRAFVMLPTEVKNLAHRGEKGGHVSYWLQPASYDTEEFAEGWNRIGCGNDAV